MNAARLLAVAALLAAPALSFAAAPQALTRADVRADLVRVERAGYQPISGDARYPADLEAALVQVRSDQNSASLSQADADRAAPLRPLRSTGWRPWPACFARGSAAAS
ncbi:DUF4148 domain-containing protein [Burkholderia sp. 22PA0099]|uniref:DUF4148 domain-containing protein n=1 Tax=Burkholderia sp. 22PA0099 TaxID=3237372 RepID=UPI0039C21955